MKVIILSGVSGSGKTTYCKSLGAHYTCSADQHFMLNGVYKFDAKELGQAHANCFYRFIGYMLDSKRSLPVVVDNTNCSTWEISPYVLGAQAFGAEVEIVTFVLKPTIEPLAILQKLAECNAHGVGFDTIVGQWSRLKERVLPQFWKNTEIEVQLGRMGEV
jgi:hypothetical protein